MGDQAAPTPHLDAKEVTGRDSLPVRFQEHRPGNTPTASRCGLDQAVFKNAPDRTAPDLYIGIQQGTANPSVAPAGILKCHSYDKLFNVNLGTGAFRVAAVPRISISAQPAPDANAIMSPGKRADRGLAAPLILIPWRALQECDVPDQ